MKQERYEEWRKDKGYGYKWLVESAFSSIKRTVGEHITSKKMDRIVDWKTQLYNRYIELLLKNKHLRIL